MEPARDHSIDHATPYDRFLLGMYLVWRWLSVAVATPATLQGRRRYRRPWLATAAWLLLTGEMAWSSVHLWRHRRNGRAAVWADTATSAAITVAFPYAMDAHEADPWHAWGVEQTNFQAEALTFTIESVPERAAAITLLATAQLLRGVLAPGDTDWSQAARAAATTMFRGLSTSLFADAVRANVARRDEAHLEAVAASRDAALQKARARHRRYLQHRSLGVLDAVAGAEHPRAPKLRAMANREAALLRAMLMPADGQLGELADVVTAAAECGVDLEVVPGAFAGAVPPHAVEALRAAVAAAFGDDRHGQGSVRRAILFVDTVDEQLVATLRGDGVRREVRLAL